MKIIQSAFFMLLAACCINCVIKSQEVIATTGGSVETESIKINYTIGEPLTETFNSDDCIVTQGMNQAVYVVTSIEEIENPEYSLSLYPNPVSDNLTLTITGEMAEQVNLILYDNNSRILLIMDALGNETTFSMKDYPFGIYFIKITVGDNPVEVFQIIKE